MKDWKYILYLTAAFGLFVIVKLIAPKQYNWAVTFAHDDKNPYGAYVLSELLPSIFPEKKISHHYKTLYELKDSVDVKRNVIVLAQTFNAGKEDTDVLLSHVSEGGSAFISAQHFYGHFADTLKLNTQDNIFKSGFHLNQTDTASLRFVNTHADTSKRFSFRRDNIYNYFSKFDTTRTNVIVKNDQHLPVMIKVKWGKGNIILSSTPLAFSNIYLLSADNHSFVSTSLSYLPVENIDWTEFYQLGRMELQTPLRFILTNEPLSWAYYLSVITILIFMIFEAKRKQRIIPIIKPLANTTLEFVRTIGNLYYQNGDHKNIAEKKILFFLEQIRIKYWLSTQHLDEPFVISLAKKTGQPQDDVRTLVKTINGIHSKAKLTAEELIDLNRRIEKFNKNLL